MDLLEACYQSRKLWEDVLAAIQHVILIADMEGRILFSGPAAHRMLGYKPEEFSGENLSILFTAEDLKCLYPNLLYLAGRRLNFDGEIMLVRKDETRFIGYVVAQPCIDDAAGCSMVVICIQDIDRQKQLERAFVKNHYQDLVRIANGIAHEIRNPLVGVGGFVNRIMKTCTCGNEVKKYYEPIIANLRKIENLVKKVEYFAHLPKPVFRDVGVDEVVGAAVLPYREELALRGIALELDLCSDVVAVDRELVERALTVLMDNAMDVLPTGGRISVTARIEESFCVIRFSDDGSGITPEDMPFIFNPFFSTKADGAGIDLAVVRRIAESHGGGVRVESVPGKGTTFILKLPMERRRAIRTALLHDTDPMEATACPVRMN